MEDWKKIILAIVISILAIIVFSIYYVYLYNTSNEQILENCYKPPIIYANNTNKAYYDEMCYLNIKSNKSYSIVEVSLKNQLYEGTIDVKIITKHPVSIIFEYAPRNQNATGNRMILPLKGGEHMVHIVIREGAVYSVYTEKKLFAKQISPYILQGKDYNRLKITLWSPWGVDIKIGFIGGSKH